MFCFLEVQTSERPEHLDCGFVVGPCRLLRCREVSEVGPFLIFLYGSRKPFGKETLQPDHALAAVRSPIGNVLTLSASPDVAAGIIQSPVIAVVNDSLPALQPQNKAVH